MVLRHHVITASVMTGLQLLHLAAAVDCFRRLYIHSLRIKQEASSLMM